MNRFFVRRSGKDRTARIDTLSGSCPCREMDEIQMARSMRALAVQVRTDGHAKLLLPRKTLVCLQSLIQQARQMDRQCGDGDAALRRLVQEGHMLEACARQARAGGGMRLPASGNTPRILSVVKMLSCEGERELTEKAIIRHISEFDDVQALTMAELWAVPEAVRIVIARQAVHTAHDILGNARQRKCAEAWILRREGSLSGKTPAFFERALQLASEQELPDARQILEDYLKSAGRTPEAEIRLAHEQRAQALLSLDRLMAAKRMMDGIDWQKCFEELSWVDKELRYDPANVYAAMDDESREAVRRQVADMARRLNLSEITIARHGVNAALEAARNGEDRRSTVCCWLMNDDAMADLARRLGVDGKWLGRMVPDPDGKRCVAVITFAGMALWALWILWVGSPWLYLPGLPIAWAAANAVIGKLYGRLFSPARLLAMKVDKVPDEWRTLVVMPVLLSSEERAREICGQMEALGCLETDRNIRYLLLGDFADDAQAHRPGDGAILKAAREAVADMNKRAGWEKYGYIHRPRSYLKVDRRWMGFDRKRGALMALNRLLMGIPGAEDAFSAEGGACAWLKEGFAFVMTLDADTRFLPGTVRRLIGCMAHPLNRKGKDGKGYGILQPTIEMMPSACVNAFVRLFAGSGGINTYPVSISNLWQDLTGEGMFAGKGIYDVKAFYESLEGALPEGRILSHDLIEGAIARAGFAGNISFYDGYPPNLGAVMKRLNRWTRGDWQLLPFIFSRKPLPGGRKFTAAQRLRMIDNLLRSLYAPCLLAVLIAAVWMGSGNALAAAVLSVYLNPVLGLGNGDGLKWRRATAELALLPLTAWHMLDAVLRTLWRLAVSGKHMLDWVTAADAEHTGENTSLPGRLAAIMLIPGLLVSGWGAAAVALAALFMVGPGWIRDMEKESFDATPLSHEQIAVLNGLARDTWHFFEKYVPDDGTGLPPDNVQIDPPAGVAARTSPTNIGLYILSCLAASQMGLIRYEEMIRRVRRVMDSMERMEKWHGHLYNWYDIRDLSTLRPRYVSSVDSGNLAACLLLASAALSQMSDGEAQVRNLADSMRKAAENMDFTGLCDEKRMLFRIGVDGETGNLSASHYDLLASESRILSYVAIMLGQVDIKHWSKLSRTAVTTAEGNALASWSGTMFEYLMPELFMRSPVHSLLGRSNLSVVKVQKALAKRRMRPWGVSESGYYAFDTRMNYQYRAFGMKALALGGSTLENVVAPYASLLALPVDPAGAADNVSAMKEAGWTGECGLYEAADYMHSTADGCPALVKSHMAHHQGMILCALCNALEDNYLVRCFMSLPEARALHLLIQEKPVAGVRLKAPELPETTGAARTEGRSMARTARPERRLCETHLIYGGDATACITADGAVHYMKNGVCASRFSGDLISRRDGACLHVYDGETGEGCIPGQNGRMRFDAGLAEAVCVLCDVEIRMKIYLSPEDGTLYRDVTLSNKGAKIRKLALADVMPVALAPAADTRAHAVFKNLFVETGPLGQWGILCRRSKRENGEACMQLAHLAGASGAVFETDYEKLTGRMGDTLKVNGLRRPFGNSFGTVLNPVSAIEVFVEIQPGESRRLHFAMSLLEEEDDADLWLQEHLSPASADRALLLASARARTMLDFIGIDSAIHSLLQRMSAFILDGRLASWAREDHTPCGGIPRNRLWETGISGDLPILAMWLDDPGQAGNVRDFIRCHEFYHAMNIPVDLVLVNDFGGGYSRPVRDMITECIASSHLAAMQCVPGGVWVLDGEDIPSGVRRALHRAAINFRGGRNLFEQMRLMLKILEIPAGEAGRVMDIGADCMNRQTLEMANGYGGFTSDGGYAIDVYPEQTTPAPWANILANDRAGILLTERGGGYVWQGNSRSGRLTPFVNDALREGWAMMLYLINDDTGEYIRLLPGTKPHMPFRVYFDGSYAAYRFDAEKLAGEVDFCIAGEKPEVRIRTILEGRGLPRGRYSIVGLINWQMGTDAQDNVWMTTWHDGGACYASGTSDGTGYFAALDARATAGPSALAFMGRGGMMSPERPDAPGDSGGWTLRVPVGPDSGRISVEFALGWGEDAQDAAERVRRFYGDNEDAIEQARQQWNKLRECLEIHTPDPAVNFMANGFLIHQAMSARIMGRTGLYQPGGAYGFRDQLQDMLAILHIDPDRVRTHILRCAAHQFEDGDVMHWWHEPWLGVRTKITDDMLFLPWVTAAYVRHTEDYSILEENVAYLENVQIPEGREDVFMEMRPGSTSGSLHDHCMRAFRRADRTGEHGLVLMGSGDWNDGMNRVGIQGRGESVWLSEFLAACAKAYADIAPEEADRAWLQELAAEMTAAVEEHGWDGSWYLRAYTDDGDKLGGAESMVCRIDAISQAWAVLSGMNPAKCALAMDSAWEMLVDRDIGIVKLLTPPFEGTDIDPGYIAAYPSGVRENGAQYTHGACWLLLALIRMGQAERAHEVLRMLLPPCHSDSREAADQYRVEPYVMAADVYSVPPNEGRGGWTWYTGAAAWMYNCILELVGYERRGKRVRLNALLGDWPEVKVTVKFASSVYHLICRREFDHITLDGMPVSGDFIEMQDDGKPHTATFPVGSADFHLLPQAEPVPVAAAQSQH